MALAEHLTRGKSNRRTAVADEKRRDRDVQPIDQVRLEECRYRHAAAFDEHSRAAALVKNTKHAADVGAVGVVIDADDAGAADGPLAGSNQRSGAEVERLGRGVRE